jgi:opacity protein-like surface antigen
MIKYENAQVREGHLLMMMKKMKTIAGLSALAFSLVHAGGNNGSALSEVASVETPFYVGIGAGVGSVASYIYSKERVADMHLRIGYDFHSNLGVELRAAGGVTGGAHLSHSYTLGAYLKPQIALSRSLKAYALAGYARTQIKLDAATARARGVSPTTVQSGLSLGAGLEYRLNDRWSVYGEAIRYIDKQTTILGRQYATRVMAATAGVAYHF